MTRRPRRLWRWAAAACLLAFAIPYIAICARVGLKFASGLVDMVSYEMDRVRRGRTWADRVSREHWPELHAEGKEIVTALEAYRVGSGRYPTALTQLPDPQPGWSDWRYEVGEAGKPRLWIGEYDVHMFEITWTSTSGWYVNT